jgi:hypothetical protein
VRSQTLGTEADGAAGGSPGDGMRPALRQVASAGGPVHDHTGPHSEPVAGGYGDHPRTGLAARTYSHIPAVNQMLMIAE